MELAKDARQKVSSQAVEIFGEIYWLKSDREPERLQVLAGEVDRRMRELAEAQPGVSPGRLALLVALHLAEELSQVRDEDNRDRGETEKRIAAWIDRLETALGTGAAAIRDSGEASEE